MANHPNRLRPPYFSLKIECGNAAFDGDWRPQVREILNRVAGIAINDHARGPTDCATDGGVYDLNGNRVGEWRYRAGRARP